MARWALRAAVSAGLTAVIGAATHATAQTAAQTAAMQTAAMPSDGRNAPAQIVKAFDALFDGPHAGLRAVHGKGLLCEGSFTPSPGAAWLSRAAHLQGAEVPILARFSNFAAVPGLPDGHPGASPRGLAVKFLLPDGGDTDIVAHSYDGFPAGTPMEFLAFLRAVADPATLAAFAAERPAAQAFLDHPKPTPASYATEAYFGVTAFRFTDAAGMSRHGRYRFVPFAGVSHLDADAAAARAPDFLKYELLERLRVGPADFRLIVQLAGEGDLISDSSIPWPSDRRTLELGVLHLNSLVADEDERQKTLTFVPTNLVGGIAATADPLLTARTQSYRISAERRHAIP